MSLATLAEVSLGAVGFVQLVRASPLTRIRRKPFSCDTCLSGWGAILVAGVVLTPRTIDDLALWLALSLVGTGGAALGMGALAVLRSLTAHFSAAPSFPAGIDAPPVIADS